MISLAIGVLSFNKPGLTKSCWASVGKAASSFLAYGNAALSLQFIWVDNGSRDQDHKEAVSALEALPNACTTLRLTENQGFAKGMNQILSTAFSGTATHCLLLSNDVELPQDFFATLSKLDLENIKGPAIFCPTQFNLMDKRLALTHAKLDLPTFNLSHLKSPAPSPIHFPLYYPAAATLWNKQAFEIISGFNEKYFCYWEDVDLSYRCKNNNVPLIPLVSLPVFHLGRGTTAGKTEYFSHFQHSRGLFQALLGSSALPANK